MSPRLLPYMEQASLYHAINQSLSILAEEHTTIHAASVGSYACPSDPGAGTPRPVQSTYPIPASTGGRMVMSLTSYSGCFGSLTINGLPVPERDCRVAPMKIAQNNGCFNDVNPIRMASITDGLSNTIFASEKMTEHYLNADPGGLTSFGWYVTGNWGDTLLSTFAPPYVGGDDRISAMSRSASSGHPGGVHVLMGDSSVRFVKNSVDTWAFDDVSRLPVGSSLNPGGWLDNLPRPGVWQALGTRNGSEVVNTAD